MVFGDSPMNMNQRMPKEAENIRTWVEIDTKALHHNYRVFRKLIPPKCRIMAVAKSNAYGHDLVQFVSHLARMGADWFAVDSITEALALRRQHIKQPILVLGYTLPSRFADAADNDIRITISSFDGLKALAHSSKKPMIHLKVDTGMHRQGFQLFEIPKVMQWLKRYARSSGKRSAVFLEGLYTHFAASKNPAFPKETKKQIEEFEQISRMLHDAGFKFLRHAAATAAAIIFPTTHFDMVRIGIGLYGLWPSPETRAAFENVLQLRPVLSWRTIISEVKKIPKGSRMGYDLTEEVSRNSKIAVCPIGYWHGYPRVLSSIGHVLVRGRRAKVLGRVSMDMVCIDVTNVPGIAVGDVVTLIGKDGKETIFAEDLALLCGTTGYEFLTRLNPLMKRLYR